MSIIVEIEDKDKARKNGSLYSRFSTLTSLISVSLFCPSHLRLFRLEHETTDQAVDAFKEYVEALEAAKWEVGNIPQLQDLPWYQNQYGRDDPVEKVDSILPVREAFIVDDSSAAAGSSSAPDASDFKKSVNLIKSSSSSASGTNSSGSGASSANSVSGSSTSGASQLSFNLFFLGGLGLAAVALA